MMNELIKSVQEGKVIVINENPGQIRLKFNVTDANRAIVRTKIVVLNSMRKTNLMSEVNDTNAILNSADLIKYVTSGLIKIIPNR